KETDSKLLMGACDLHVHSAPDLYVRFMNDLEIAKDAADAGMKAVVLKCHVEDTAGRAYLVRKAVPGVQTFGGVVLNHAVGGLNPTAVEASIGLGGKIVWMPTRDSKKHRAHFGETGANYGGAFKSSSGKA